MAGFAPGGGKGGNLEQYTTELGQVTALTLMAVGRTWGRRLLAAVQS